MTSNSPKTLEDIVNSKKFGHLSILVPLMILMVGAIIVISSFFVGGGTHEAGIRSIEILATVITLATTGSLASYGFKSQTKIDLENYVKTISAVDVATEDGNKVMSLNPSDSDIKGNFENNSLEHIDKMIVSNTY